MPPPIRPPQFGQRGSPQGGIYDDADFLQDEGWPGTSTPNVGGIPEPLPGPQVPFPTDRQVAGPEMGEMSGPSGLSDEWTQGLQQTPLAGPVMGEGLQALPPGVSMDEWAPLDDPDADIRGELGPVSPYPPGEGYGPVPEAPDVRVTEPGGGYGPAPTGMLPPPWVPPGWSPQGRQAEEERRRTEVPPERRLLGRQRRRIGDY